MRRAIVLNSGGADSTTCVGLAVSRYGPENTVTISIHYGQKHEKEIISAQKVADYYGLKHFEYDLSDVFRFSNSSLLSHSSKEIENGRYIEQIKNNEIVTTYIPFRNGLFLSTAASIAMSIFPDDEVDVFYGAHADDYANNAYADCSIAFAEAMAKAIHEGTYGKVSLVCPFIKMNKSEVIKTGLSLDVPYELTWSCYQGGEKHCGRCATCIDRKEAFRANGVNDPVEYEN